MSGGEIAGLIAALAFVALVAFLAMTLLKLHGVLDNVVVLLRDVDRTAIPLLEEVRETLGTVHSQLDRVEGILGFAESTASSVSKATGLVTTAVANPVVKGLSVLAGVGAGARAIKRKKAR